jgi:hypothetical protein
LRVARHEYTALAEAALMSLVQSQYRAPEFMQFKAYF